LLCAKATASAILSRIPTARGPLRPLGPPGRIGLRGSRRRGREGRARRAARVVDPDLAPAAAPLGPVVPGGVAQAVLADAGQPAGEGGFSAELESVEAAQNPDHQVLDEIDRFQALPQARAEASPHPLEHARPVSPQDLVAGPAVADLRAAHQLYARDRAEVVHGSAASRPQCTASRERAGVSARRPRAARRAATTQ
jgi:hypothetical protein